MTRPMNCWVQARKNGPWHQAWRRGDEVMLCCSGRVLWSVDVELMASEWRPVNEFGSQCQQAACQDWVAP